METGNLSEDYRPLILVAEDDDSNFKLIKAIIGKKCEILWAKNGEEMVGLFKENRGKTAAILMDIKMPIMNGLKRQRSFAKKKRNFLSLCRLPMLLRLIVKMQWLPVLRKYW